MPNFDAQIVDLIGGTIDQTACDQWAVEGAREIIMQLPASLEERCSDKTALGDGSPNPTTLDLSDDDNGKVLYCTRNNGSYDIPCRLVEPQYAHLTEDSTSTNYYAVADDPAYFIRDNKVEIRPQPTDSNVGYVYHILYPTSIDVSAHASISNFPTEAEHLVVLYAAIRQLFANQASMSSSWNSNITTALGAIATELNKADDIINTAHTKVGDFYTSIGDIDNTTELWDDTNKRFTVVRDALLHSQNLLSGNAPSGDYDVYGNLSDIDTELGNEDIELASGRMQQASTTLNAVSTELNRANVAIAEINTLMASYSLELQGVPQYISTASGYISQAAGYVGEANARLQQDSTKYQWFGDQYAKLSAEYTKGLAALKEIK